jgi:hypothetical protein
MTTSKPIPPSISHWLLTGVGAAAVALAFFVMGYGIVELPDRSLLMLNDAGASMQTAQGPGADPQEDTTTRATTAHERQPVSRDEHGDRIDALRECAPDKGITADCPY